MYTKHMLPMQSIVFVLPMSSCTHCCQELWSPSRRIDLSNVWCVPIPGATHVLHLWYLWFGGGGVPDPLDDWRLHLIIHIVHAATIEQWQHYLTINML